MEDEISDGVKILCDRMENNLEDFLETDFDPSTLHRKLGKFYYEGKQIESLAKGEIAGKETFWYLNDTEKAMLVKAYVAMERRLATQRVVEKLLTTDEPAPEVKRKGPLTKAQIVKDSLAQLNREFDKAYAENHATDTYRYVAKDRYQLDLPWK